MNQDLQITEVDKNDLATMQQVWRLRYETYFETQHFADPDADMENRWLKDDRDTTATILIARVNGSIVGTVRLLRGGQSVFSAGEIAAYGLDRLEGIVSPDTVATVDRFMVTPEHRGGGPAAMLMMRITQIGLEQGVQVAFCDCEPHLVNLYRRFGFMPYKSVVSHAAVGVLVPLVVVRDVVALKSRNALMSRMIPSDTVGTDQATVLRALSDSVPGIVSEESGGLSDVISQLVTQPDNYWLFANITDEDAARILKSGHRIDLNDGDMLVREGHVSTTMYSILTGTFEVRHGTSVVDVIGPGDTFGEVAFLLDQPRTADVVSIGPSSVVAFDTAKLRALIDSNPTLAATFLLNLSKLLCRKFTHPH
jgi:predicted GNAT family N-acyltransferase